MTNTKKAVLGYDSNPFPGTSAREFYSSALSRMGIDYAGVDDVAALRALFNLAAERAKVTNSVRTAFDSTDMAEKFPNAMREIREL